MAYCKDRTCSNKADPDLNGYCSLTCARRRRKESHHPSQGDDSGGGGCVVTIVVAGAAVVSALVALGALVSSVAH